MLGEAIRSLSGAALLFVGRQEGLDRLDRTFRGFWRSFLAIGLLIPLNFVASAAVDAGGRGGRDFADQLPLIVLDWLLFPLILALVAEPLGIARRYVSYVVARNWAAPIAATLLTIPLILEGAGWVPALGGALLSVVALGLALRYHFMVVRLSLGVPVMFAIGLVAADFLLTIVLVSFLG
ncbi:MAG: hypothetical protein AAF318_04210 [Pseudomonadota bacterium]